MIDKKFEKAKKLLEFLNNQEIDMVISGDYDKLNPEIEDDMDYKGGFSIVLDNIQIGFSFDKDGNFEGIYNWKQ